ncbi:DUF6044 family protein [Butyrivibrio sp. YAB3001]|uniref:DUF6044 family protein n=1 Tax=Butyrivibrio sp. YAB3001 TaxID=1520812 RepID=UPI0008F67073|nr:DUF6044 family protein [Butyrivibrio sp. YAB3001]SFC17193.1 hypothetical protein SAMN02910398_01636 [Butyrivibrio sp. YAB3001]
MKKFEFKKNWYIIFTGALLALQTAVFLIFRGESYPQIHDNLDLFMAHYEMLKKGNLWFSHNVNAPILHGISRDLFGSEFNLYNLFYIILPGFWAYFAGYASKIAIGIISFILLSKDIYKDKYKSYKPLIIVVSVAYGMIPVFPTYGIAFTSVPLIILFLRKLYYAGSTKQKLLCYLAIFLYPLLSYFSYHGFFILCYMVVAVIILWIKDKRFPLSIFVSIVVLSLGYVLFEYRLFGAMLFNDTVTIRTTMDHGDLSLPAALATAFSEFVNASFHSEDSHTYVVLGVVLAAIVCINISYIKNKEYEKILHEPINLLMLWVIFNVLIFGLYQYEPFRHLFELLVPPLTGFEFARTAYFNTFLWYALLLLVCTRMYDFAKKGSDTIHRLMLPLANIIVVLAAVVVMFMPQVYNDFYYTCYNQAYKILRHKDTSTVNYNEFYSTSLFDKIIDDIDYNGEWSAAYGMHPAVLNYNGIATVDGYLGMYAQDYKETWTKVIEPALEGSPSLKSYFLGWGARVSLYSGSDENTYAPLRNLELTDTRLIVNMDELKKLDCKYIFSRIEFSNATEIGLKLIGTYTDESSPYTIFVYDTGCN